MKKKADKKSLQYPEVKKKYLLAHPDRRKESWSKYNQSKRGREKKHEWYRQWAGSLGVRTWEEWVEIRKAGAKPSVYPSKFNKKFKEKIIARDDYTCRTCGMTDALSKILWGKRMGVHHIDYDKDNLSEDNLMAACIRCNSHMNTYRNYWQIHNGQKKPNVFVVIPSNRESSLKAFLEVWKDELKDCTILIVEDSPQKTFNLPEDKNILHFSHQDIKDDLGDNHWIIPKRTGAICSYGFYKAWKMGADVIVKMDDDIFSRKAGFIQSHLDNLFKPRPLHWMNVFAGGYPRGFPYTERTRITVFNYGLADNVLDFDATTQILGSNARIMGESLAIPYGCNAPICGMNIAFLAEIVPALYFGLQGNKFGVDRFDDIWAGVFLKKITDHLGHVIAIGEPVITHNRLSNPISNLDKEAGGMDINEVLWQEVNKIKLRGSSYGACYKELANKLNLPVADYGDRLKQAMSIWADLYK